MQNEYDYLFKVLLTGSSPVGKTSIMMRFAQDEFNENHLPTIGVDFKIKTIVVNEKKIKLQVPYLNNKIWDTAGQERFKTITKSYYNGAHGIFIVYDVTDRSSFKDVQGQLASVGKEANKDVVLFLIGNKSDLEGARAVTYEEGKSLADSLKIGFIETSAKTSANVEQAFLTIIEEIKSKLVQTQQQ